MTRNIFRIVLVVLITFGASAIIAAAVFLKGLDSAYAIIIGFSTLIIAALALMLRGIQKVLRWPSFADSSQDVGDQGQQAEIEEIVSEDDLPDHRRSGVVVDLAGVSDTLGGVYGVGEYYNRLTGKTDSVKQPGGLYGDDIVGYMYGDDDD